MLNADGPPRRGSFEVSLAASPSVDANERTLIWTGLKNTPRATKFPQAEKIAEDIKLRLSLVEPSILKQEENNEKSSTSSQQEEEEVIIAEDKSTKGLSSTKSKRSRSKK